MKHPAKDEACAESKALGGLLKLIQEKLQEPELSPLKGTGSTFHWKGRAGDDEDNEEDDEDDESPQDEDGPPERQGATGTAPPEPEPNQLAPPNPLGRRVPPPTNVAAKNIDIKVTPAEGGHESDPKPFQHLQVYRATSEDLLVALNQILDDAERPGDYSLPGARTEQKPSIAPINQDQSGMLTASNAGCGQGSQPNQSQLKKQDGKPRRG